MAHHLTTLWISHSHVTDAFWWNADIENNVCTEKHTDLSEFSCCWPFVRAWERQQRGVLFLISLLTTNTSCFGPQESIEGVWMRVKSAFMSVSPGQPEQIPPPLLVFKQTCGRLSRLTDTNHKSDKQRSRQRNCKGTGAVATDKPGRDRGETSGLPPVISQSLPGRGDRLTVTSAQRQQEEQREESWTPEIRSADHLPAVKGHLCIHAPFKEPSLHCEGKTSRG